MSSSSLHVGVLTGGGDCPGLNAVIRGVTKSLLRTGARVTGIERGFMGMIERRSRPLDARAVSGIINEGGTILGTHNFANPFAWKGEDVSPKVMEYVKELGLDALVAIGGDGTMSIANRFTPLGLPVVGVPKTIDNDLMYTDRTFGFDSAVSIVAEALARLETTARSHGRVMVLETMGRYAGWIALEGGLAGGADIILIPERPYDLQEVIRVCKEREKKQGYTIICIAEGARPVDGRMTVQAHLENSPDPIRLGGVANVLREQLKEHLESEVRSTQLGHVQRGGTPTPYDRVLATRFGWYAAKMVANGEFGRMVALKGDECTSVPIEEVANRTRNVPDDSTLLDVATSLGISLGQPA
jgi:6-phosphofructokinase